MIPMGMYDETEFINQEDERIDECHAAGYWVTGSKKKIKISDMEDSHLVNTIVYLRRKAQMSLDADLMLAISAGDDAGGDGTLASADNAVDNILEYDAHSHAMKQLIYRKLMKEADQRNLEVD